MSAIKQGMQKNKLLRYQPIKEEWKKYEKMGVPTTKIWLMYIYPKFHISRTTLYNIIGTPITAQLQELEQTEKMQLKLF